MILLRHVDNQGGAHDARHLPTCSHARLDFSVTVHLLSVTVYLYLLSVVFSSVGILSSYPPNV